MFLTFLIIIIFLFSFFSEPQSEYVISLSATNEAGQGLPTYENVRTTEKSAPESVTPLTPPIGLKAIVLSANTVVLYWTDMSLSKSQVNFLFPSVSHFVVISKFIIVMTIILFLDFILCYLCCVSPVRDGQSLLRREIHALPSEHKYPLQVLQRHRSQLHDRRSQAEHAVRIYRKSCQGKTRIPMEYGRSQSDPGSCAGLATARLNRTEQRGKTDRCYSAMATAQTTERSNNR